MTNYNEYRSAAGITTKQMVKTVSEEFPRFSKIQCSMISNPEYGVCLLPEAEELLINEYGYAPGLNKENTQEKKVVVRKPEKRKKRNRFVVRLDDSTAGRVWKMMRGLGYVKTQDFLEDAIAAMLTNWEGNNDGARIGSAEFKTRARKAEERIRNRKILTDAGNAGNSKTSKVD